MSEVLKNEQWQFGDFQTPALLADQVISLLTKIGIEFHSVVEPSCGKGAFVLSALKGVSSVRQLIGRDVNSEYINELKESLSKLKVNCELDVAQEDFFNVDWAKLLNKAAEPILILGNPPWVTNSDLGMLNSSNLPSKSNIEGLKGISAVTGKSNFDISEWMLLEHLKWLQNRRGAVAVLCKVSVARKILKKVFGERASTFFSGIFRIDAKKYFDASVDACLFVLSSTQGELLSAKSSECAVYDSLDDRKPSAIIGLRDGIIMSDIASYDQLSHLFAKKKLGDWRSGVKHDCSRIMELALTEQGLKNGLGDHVDVEDAFVFPLLKGSDIGRGRVLNNRCAVLITQRSLGEETSALRILAPKLWSYLNKNESFLSARKSSIYRGKPRFSIFGVGDYTFAPYKVAICGLYKNLNFAVISPIDGKPVIFDDTVAFLPCSSFEMATVVCELLNSEPCQRLLKSIIFLTDKRPVTVELLNRIDLQAIAQTLGLKDVYESLVRAADSSGDAGGSLSQLPLAI